MTRIYAMLGLIEPCTSLSHQSVFKFAAKTLSHKGFNFKFVLCAFVVLQFFLNRVHVFSLTRRNIFTQETQGTRSNP